MSSFIFSGGVEVLGFISPTDTSDEYAVIDPLYGIDGLRNVSSISELNAITTLRRRPGMVVGVNNGSEYYKLNPAPWNGTLTDWSLFTPGIFTGGTVSGETNFTSSVTATTFSAGTYLNLPIDNTVTGGTYNPSTGSVTFTNNTGGTFTVTGFITGFTDIQVTGYTYSDNTFTIYDSSGNTFSATINQMTGLTVNGEISATTISASTYQNLPITTLTVNSTPISGGTSGRVFFENSANTLSQSSNLFWDNANGRLGVGTSLPGRPLTVVNSILGVVALFGGQNAAPSWVGIGSVDGGSSPFIQGYDTSVTGTTKLSLNANGSNVLIGTTTDAGFRLDVNGTARVQGEANVSFLSLAGNTAVNNSGSIMILGASAAWTGVRVPRYFEISGSVNASSGFTRGTFINQTLVATANNDTLYALDIAPSFTTGSFTGVTSVPLRIRNSSGTGNAFYIDGIGNAVIAGSLNTNTVYGSANINLSSGSGNLLLQTNFTVNTGLVMFNSTRNIVIQNGGTFVDAGFRLDVSGNTRINGGLTATTISATTYQNLPSDVIIINSTQIQSGSTGGILFQSSASTVSQSSNLFWNSSLNRLGIGTTSLTNTILNISGNISGSISSASIRLIGTVQSDVVQAEGVLSQISIANNFTLNALNHFYILQGVIGTGSILNNQNGFFVGFNFTGATNNFGFRGQVPSGVGRWNLYMDGTANNYLSGKLLLNTTTDAGYQLDVVGSSRVSASSTIWVFDVISSVSRVATQNSNLFSITMGGVSTGQTAQNPLLVQFDASQSGLGGYTVLRVNSTQTTLGSGSKLLQTWELNGVQRSVVNSLGNFGIGTTNPQALLNVANTGTTGTTALFSGAGQNVVTIVGSGSTQPIFTIQGSSGELFSVTDSLTGSLFSVNDISGLPILEVFSNNTTLMGSYLAPSLNTTAYVIATTGTTNVYSIPTSAYTGAFFDYTVSDGTNLRAGNIMSIWSGTSVNFTETSTTDFGNTSGLTFNMVVSSGNAILRTSGTTGNWTVKTIVRSI